MESQAINLRSRVFRHANSHARLTKAERATYELMQKGLTSEAIAVLLGLKHETIKNRVRIIQEKLDEQA